MPNLFGINFAHELATCVANSGGFPALTITRSTPGTRTPGELTGGTNPTSATYTGHGFMEVREMRRVGQVGASQVPVVSILGASVSSGISPAVNDIVNIEGANYLLLRLIARDGAAALYEFEAKES